MVKGLGHMSDFWSSLTQAQHEFEILHPVEGRIEPRLRGKRAPDAEQVPDIHRAAKIFRRPVRFEKGLDYFSRRIIELVLIRIDNVETLVCFFPHRLESQWMKKIVVIEETNVIA